MPSSRHFTLAFTNMNGFGLVDKVPERSLAVDMTKELARTTLDRHVGISGFATTH